MGCCRWSIVATPGRLLHLIVEMNLDLRSVQYVVFDEADRLFEMGFETALSEIIHRLPASRQTLLFSATLPKSLIEFAKAGLQEPKLVRLDADSKISSDLRMAFFSVKQAEKESCLLALLRNVIKIPLRGHLKDNESATEQSSKDKGKGKERPHTAPHQTIVFTATKHHVEYITMLLTSAGFSVAHIYGKLDQTARSQQLQRFLQGSCDILVVTDVAARGIDVPVLANVVNYDFPGPGARLFVHRVGRTARAGAKGWAWSFVNGREVPFLLDLQLFLGRPLKVAGSDSSLKSTRGSGEEPFVNSMIFGSFPRAWLDDESEYIRTLGETVSGLTQTKDVMTRAQGMYERTQGRASQASYRRAKEIVKSGGITGEGSVHPVFTLFDQQAGPSTSATSGGEEGVTEKKTTSPEEQAKMEEARTALLRAVSSFSPSETVFEIGNKAKAGKTANSVGTAALMKDRRKALAKARERALPTNVYAEDKEIEVANNNVADVEMANDEDIEAAFGSSSSKPTGRKFRDSEFYMSHFQKDSAANKGYSLRDGASFAEQARGATFEVADDDGKASRQKSNQMRWDTKKKKFIKGDGVGADNMKLVKTESGARLPATYRSGRFEEWKAKTHKNVPRVGEAELPSAGGHGRHGANKRFKHHKTEDAKPLDKLSLGYERKKSGGAVRKGGRYAGKTMSRVKSELKSAAQIRKDRAAVEKRKAKNARPSRKKGKR
ncbi:P-loop containing nucleoside triphosphate hydrolase protein [Schizopora paradoxa]|uniref:RNA helicase n=1 Tax=Schizopora paradoxa TaxID=27342 RepID=A0A0H2S5G0_9AGAM|nr:P-loop containing nucleoside triphosphate hydrolase protein [Schizopora paradoxa]